MLGVRQAASRGGALARALRRLPFLPVTALFALLAVPFKLCTAAPQEADHWEKAWETLILSLIGESLPSASAINGAYLSDKTRRGRVMFRLELWSTKMLDSSVSRMCQEALSAAKPKQFSVKV